MNDDNVVDLETFVTGAIDLEPDDVLRAAVGKLERVVVAGWDQDGELYVASSSGAEDALWILEKAKKFLLEEG